MEQNPSREANIHPASQEIPRLIKDQMRLTFTMYGREEKCIQNCDLEN